MKANIRFDAIFDKAAIGFALMESTTGKIVKVNNKFCEILGFDTRDAESTTFMAITHPDDLQEDLDNMKKLIAGDLRDFSMEKRYVRKDGAIFWVSLTVSALWDVGEEPDYHIAVVEDITARKRAEEQLQNTNELLEQRVERRTTALQAKMQELQALNMVLKEHEKELFEKNKDLLELNTALKVLLQKKDEANEEMGLTMLANISAALEPSLEKLAHICPDERQQELIKRIRAHLKTLLMPFARNLAIAHSNLTSTEIKVADLIRHGFSSREIAAHLYISSETVAFHRKNLRKKFGLSKSNENLAEYLQKMT